MNCKLAGICSGCPLILTPLKHQRADKKSNLQKNIASFQLAGLEKIEIAELQDSKLRDRADLSFKRNKLGDLVLGLYKLDSKDLVDIEECPQMSETLNQLLGVFRENLPPIDFGSVRLRVSPTGEFGFWFDIPNLSVKFLLDEQAYLRKILQLGFVEIGQKRKKLVDIGDRLALEEPEHRPWFETYIGAELKPTPLNILVGGFSQVGFAANRALLSSIQKCIQSLNIKKVLELCSGSGNISLALASWGMEVSALEIDDTAVEATMVSATRANLQNQIRTVKMNVHKNSTELVQEFGSTDLILVDPPRSGLGASLDVIEALEIELLPTYFLYVSCFLPSLMQDLSRLGSLGYRLSRAIIVDQFAHSPHCEYVILLTR